VPLKLNHFNAAIVASVDQSERAFELLREVSNQGLAPDMITMAAAVHVAEKAHRYDDALKFTEALANMIPRNSRQRMRPLREAHLQMKALKLPPPALTCTALVMSHLEMGQWKKASDVLKKLQALGGKVSWPVLELLAVAFDDAGLEKEATRIRSTANSSTVLNYSDLSGEDADQVPDDGSDDYYARMTQTNLTEVEQAAAWEDVEKNPSFYFG